jgi:transcriptional regulator with XRE-family HTH domain
MPTNGHDNNFFRSARRALGGKQGKPPSMNKIAQQLGVDPTTVWSWETNKSVPQKRLIPAVASVLNVSISELGEAVAIQQARQQQERAA